MYKFAARKETMGDHLIISTLVLSEEKVNNVEDGKVVGGEMKCRRIFVTLQT